MRLVIELSGPLSPGQKRGLRIAGVMSGIIAVALLALWWAKDYEPDWRHKAYSKAVYLELFQTGDATDRATAYRYRRELQQLLASQRKYHWWGAERKQLDLMLKESTRAKLNLEVFHEPEAAK